MELENRWYRAFYRLHQNNNLPNLPVDKSCSNNKELFCPRVKHAGLGPGLSGWAPATGTTKSRTQMCR